MYLSPRATGKVTHNSKETTFEVDSHADATCLGSVALNIFDYNCIVNVQGYDASLDIRQYSTISWAIAYILYFVK